MLELVYGIGDVWEDKLPKYLFYSTEKSARLLTHPDHVSSWQSRRPRFDEYGGAIRTEKGLLSFSGLREDLDHTLMVAVGAREHVLTGDEVIKIMNILTQGKPEGEVQAARAALSHCIGI
ncbi:MAG: hypothetical protein V1846_05025 [Candidatus Komeilibacteria bacterium]